MINRAVNAVYPPASTFKIIMSTAMLQENAFPLNKKIECKGKIVYGGRTFNCHIHEPGHGWLDLKNGFAEGRTHRFMIVAEKKFQMNKN